MPTPSLIAVPIVVSDPTEVEAAFATAVRAAEHGADLVEWRVDELEVGLEGGLEGGGGGVSALRDLVAGSPLPSIVTCRSPAEGGAGSKSIDERIELMLATLEFDHPPAYIDVEMSTWADPAAEPLRLALAARREGATGDDDAAGPRLILSLHDFVGRPERLLPRLGEMAAEPLVRVIKVAWRARSLRDTLEIADLLRERHGPMIALGMGPFGLPSRVLAPVFGGWLTFAAIEAGATSAPGQPTLRDLLERYRFRSLGPGTKVFGVIGWPVEHSRSPDLHNAGFDRAGSDRAGSDRAGFDGVYLPLPVPAEWEHFKATLGSFLADDGLNFRGASVTLPHKQHAIRYVREAGGAVDPLADRIGAANTIVVDDAGGLRAVNTDAPALIAAIREDGGLAELAGKSALVLGAGGVARAAVFGLADERVTLTICARNPERAAALAAELTATNIAVVASEDLAGARFDLIVNATPVGMEGGPDPEGDPLPADVVLGSVTCVFDTVYTPIETPLVKRARAAGARVVTGDGMFVRQAEAQFALFTGGPPESGLFARCVAATARTSADPHSQPRP